MIKVSQKKDKKKQYKDGKVNKKNIYFFIRLLEDVRALTAERVFKKSLKTRLF